MNTNSRPFTQLDWFTSFQKCRILRFGQIAYLILNVSDWVFLFTMWATNTIKQLRGLDSLNEY